MHYYDAFDTRDLRDPLPGMLTEPTPGEFSLRVTAAGYSPTRDVYVLGLLLWAYGVTLNNAERLQLSTFAHLCYNAAAAFAQALAGSADIPDVLHAHFVGDVLDRASALAPDPATALELRLRVRYLQSGADAAIARLERLRQRT